MNRNLGISSHGTGVRLCYTALLWSPVTDRKNSMKDVEQCQTAKAYIDHPFALLLYIDCTERVSHLLNNQRVSKIKCNAGTDRSQERVEGAK